MCVTTQESLVTISRAISMKRWDKFLTGENQGGMRDDNVETKEQTLNPLEKFYCNGSGVKVWWLEGNMEVKVKWVFFFLDKLLILC